MTMRSGILAAGNWICDHVKTVDIWPAQDGLATIVDHTVANGGGPYNILKDLAKLGAGFPLTGVGLLGDDADGRSILDDCRAHGIDTSPLHLVPGATTSFTDVMTERGTGRRTFFHARGANALLGPEHFDFTLSKARIFYLGYLMLLDRLDSPGPDGAPRARDVLRQARIAGCFTALDCVSAPRAGFRGTVGPVLPEVDVLFANDYEAELLTSLTLGRGATLDHRAVAAATWKLITLGVRRWAIVHFPEGACACSPSGEFVWQPSVRLPPMLIAGAAGAGDAFAAGVLLGLHNEWPIAKALKVGVAAAATSLLHPTCSAGVRSAGDCLAFADNHGFMAIESSLIEDYVKK